MTLRRSDSLPPRLRVVPIKAQPDVSTVLQKIPESNTVPNFNENPNREEVIATWKSLHEDVKNIKNGFTTNNEPANRTSDKESITHNFTPAFTGNNRDVRKKFVENRPRGDGQKEADRCSSLPLETGQAIAIERRANSARRRTLLQRLLSWRAPECDCSERYVPKYCPPPRLRPEDLLCTCGVSANRINNQFKRPDQCIRFSERGRSKSVGYEAAREVAQFRRLVLCRLNYSSALVIVSRWVIFKCVLVKVCVMLGVRVPEQR